MGLSEFDLFVENHLNLQVKISYLKHHDFLLRHHLNKCSLVLDVGTGNGTFVSRLATDHPHIQFTGVDKRKKVLESCKKITNGNIHFYHLDMFSSKNSFDFSLYDGFLMRYFLLHTDNSRKILELLKLKSKRPTKFWIIDLDWSQTFCTPENEIFNKMILLLKNFCSKISTDSMGGQNVLPILKDLNYQNIVLENIPFSKSSIHVEDLVLYLIQEVQCYSIMSGRPSHDPETLQILRFLDEEVRSESYSITYGMNLIYAELN